MDEPEIKDPVIRRRKIPILFVVAQVVIATTFGLAVGHEYYGMAILLACSLILMNL